MKNNKDDNNEDSNSGKTFLSKQIILSGGFGIRKPAKRKTPFTKEEQFERMTEKMMKTILNKLPMVIVMLILSSKIGVSGIHVGIREIHTCCQGIHVGVQGIHTCSQGIHVGIRGIHTYRQGIHVGIYGIHTWCQGIHTWCQGIHTWCQGIHTWCQGIHMWCQGIHTWCQGIHTWCQGIHTCSQGIAVRSPEISLTGMISRIQNKEYKLPLPQT